MRGKIVYVEHESRVLKGNPLGDPHVRKFPVYLPPDYDSGKRYPVIFGLVGFSGTGAMYLNKSIMQQPFDDLLDELIVKKGMPGVIYAMPDCMTYVGGSQYVNSSAVGRYEDYIVEELVPFMDREFHTTSRRACIGGSSGGIGSFTLAAKHPEIFQAFGNHSGDSAFDASFLAEIPRYVQAIAKYDRDVEKFFRAIPTHLPKDENYATLLIMTACAATYSPNPSVKLGFELPFDTYTGELRPEVWKKWVAFDPVNMVEPLRDNLKKVEFMWIDCGTRDQHHLWLGSRQLHQRLDRFGLKHVYEEYDSNHGLMRREQKKKSIPAIVEVLNRR